MPRAPKLLLDNLAVGTGTVLSRATGLARTLLVFAVLTKSLGDAYVTAGNTPNMVFELLLGGTIAAVLIPTLTGARRSGDDGAARALTSAGVWASGAAALVGIPIAVVIVLLVSAGSGGPERAAFLRSAVPLAVLFAPQILFYGITATATAALSAHHRFHAANAAPVACNLVTIASLVGVWLAVGEPAAGQGPVIATIGLGGTAAVAVMAFIVARSARAVGFGVASRPDFGHPAVRQARRAVLFGLGFVAANQAASLIVTALASPGTGNVRVYQTAFQVFMLPYSLLAVSLMATLMPRLSHAWLEERSTRFALDTTRGLRVIVFVMAGAGTVLTATAVTVARTPWAGGPFPGSRDALLWTVAAFALGLPACSLYQYLVRAVYASGDSRAPLRFGVIQNALNVVLAVGLVRWMGVGGLALAYSVSYAVASVAPFRHLAQRSPSVNWRRSASQLKRSGLAGGAGLGAAALAAAGLTAVGVDGPLVLGAVVAAASASVYLSVLLALGQGRDLAAARVLLARS